MDDHANLWHFVGSDVHPDAALATRPHARHWTKHSNRIVPRSRFPRLLGGPIEIAKQAGKSAEEGLGRLLLFLTMLSANLAVINFLPIPVLDGGHMVFLMYELVRGKPPSENVVAALSYIGLILLLSLMLFVFGLDLGLIARR